MSVSARSQRCRHSLNQCRTSRQYLHGISRVIDAAAKSQADAARNQAVGDVTRIRDGPGQPVQLRHDQGVSPADGGKGLVQAGTQPVRPGQAAVHVNPVVRDPERHKGTLLGGEVLLVGKAPGIADQGICHEVRDHSETSARTDELVGCMV